MTRWNASGLRQVLVDASAFFAIFNTRDPKHELATSTLSQLTRERSQVLTTNFLVAETHALLLNRRGRDLAVQFLTVLQGGDPAIVRVTEDDEERAKAIIFQYDDKDFSYVDTTSFAVMERLGIDEGFSFDRHFRQYGWRMLPERLP